VVTTTKYIDLILLQGLVKDPAQGTVYAAHVSVETYTHENRLVVATCCGLVIEAEPIQQPETHTTTSCFAGF